MVSAFWVINASLVCRTSHHSRAKWRSSFQICCECEACSLPYAIQWVIHMHIQHRLGYPQKKQHSNMYCILHKTASMFTFSFGYVSSCWKSKWHNCMAQNTKRKWKISVSRSKRKEVKPNSKQIQHVVPHALSHHNIWRQCWNHIFSIWSAFKLKLNDVNRIDFIFTLSDILKTEIIPWIEN